MNRTEWEKQIIKKLETEVKNIVIATCKKHNWKYEDGMADLVIMNMEYEGIVDPYKAVEQWESDTEDEIWLNEKL